MSETLETIRTTAVDLRIHVDGNDVVVDVGSRELRTGRAGRHPQAPGDPRGAANRQVHANLWVEELTCPECTEAERTHEDLVGAEALIAGLREVGDTAIAHLIGLEDFLATARHLLVEVTPKGAGAEVVITTRP